ncbi:MAG: DUF1501 domain-containing protein [Pseudomonadota bacterium]
MKIDQSRRRFIQGLGTAGLVAGAPLGLLSSLPSYAADTSGYKALVCVFLFGGLDGHDVLLPYDLPSYQSFVNARPSFVANQPTRARDQLLKINPTNLAESETREFALPPEMPQLHTLFEQGNAALVANVGPLINPTDRAAYLSETVALPPRLYSHNDQQAIWQAGSPEGALLGWGGLVADPSLGSAAAQPFATITTEGSGLFLTGEKAAPYLIGLDSGVFNWLLDSAEDRRDEYGNESAYTAARRHVAGQTYSGNNLIARDIANLQNSAVNANELFNQAVQNAPTLSTVFPASPLGTQLQAVARALSIRNNLNVNRQVFFVGIGGFDTHSNQVRSLGGLLSQIDAGIAAFQTSLAELNLVNEVTLFTASDFGRTLSVNGDGTDHGWGGHHFVVGGGVNGKSIFGNVPPSTINHTQDAGGGRLIPTTSIEQFAAPMASWFGLSSSEINTVFPNLSNFTDPALPLFNT